MTTTTDSHRGHRRRARRRSRSPLTTARALIAVGAVATIASTFMSWTYTTDFPGDLTYYGYPGGLQILDPRRRRPHPASSPSAPSASAASRWLNPAAPPTPSSSPPSPPSPSAGTAPSPSPSNSSGLANLDPGAYIAAVGSAIALVGALALPKPR